MEAIVDVEAVKVSIDRLVLERLIRELRGAIEPRVEYDKDQLKMAHKVIATVKNDVLDVVLKLEEYLQ